jgi:two-component system response regulator DegU
MRNGNKPTNNHKPKILTKHVVPAVIKIAVVDDQHMFREGIVSLLDEYDGFKVIMEASNGKELLEQMKRQTPHVVLLDIEMPEMNGIETVMKLKEIYPAVRVIMLTMHNEEEFIFHLMTKGAHGFVPKDKSVEEVATAILSVMETGVYKDEKIMEALINGSNGGTKTPQSASLTEREIEVIRLICMEKTNKEIADHLNISYRTVESFRSTILLKTGSKNTAGMVMFALKHRLITGLDMI